MKKYILSGILSVLVMSALLITVRPLAFDVKESAFGEGTLIHEDGSKSRFSLNVSRKANGKVSGQSILRNPSYKATNGQNSQIKIDISCLKVVGNVAVFGGVTKRKNNQTNFEAAYFAVEDNGDLGQEADKIFRGFFYDDDPATKGDPELYQSIEPLVLVSEPIAEGNIQVKVKQGPIFLLPLK